MTMRAVPKKDRLKSAVESEKSCRGAGFTWDVAKSSVNNHRSGRYATYQVGRPPIFSYDEEKEILRCLQVLADSGFGLSRSVASEAIN